jgi:hypothetical protein
MINFCLTNFNWPGFNHDDNFFISMFKDIYQDDINIVKNVEDSDLCLFPENAIPENINKSKTKTISFMPEPKEVNYSCADYHISFDPTRNDIKNVRLPLWYVYINFYNLSIFNQEPRGTPAATPEELENNKWKDIPKNNFCISPFSSIRKERIDFYNILNTYKPTFGFGLPFNNGDEERSTIKKHEIISTFKFCTSFENTNKLGYVTEKILQAKTAGCIPIFWGNHYVLSDFNPDSFIYVNNFSSMQECLEYIKFIDNNDKLYETIKTAPMFKYNVKNEFMNIKKQLKDMISL